MTTTAYSYIRFSRPEQMKGNSLTRQLEKSNAYCTANNLILDKKLNLNDLGISAFKGKNLDENAALGGFIKAIDEGKVAYGSYLLIESLDRLSRQQISDAFDAFKSIIKKGIIIVTLSDNTIYDEESLNDFGKLIVSLAIMSRAHEESKTKSMRLLAANKNKRNNIKNKKLSSICPAWLSYDKEEDDFKPIPDKVNVVELIFELSASGMGTYSIITELAERNIKSIGKSDKWYQSYLSKILKGREVLGELQSKSADGSQVFTGYYPQVISDDLYYKVQLGIKSRQNKSGGRKGKAISNLFSKITYCGYSNTSNDINTCTSTNEPMVLNNKGKYKYLQCRAAKASNSCKDCRRLWRYDVFEYWLLLHIKEIDASILFPSKNTEGSLKALKNNIATLNGKLSEVTRRIKVTNDTMFESVSDMTIPQSIINILIELESNETKLTSELAECKAKLLVEESNTSTPKEYATQLKELIKLMPNLEDNELHSLRIDLSELLKQSIERIDAFTCGIVKREKPYHLAKVTFKSGFVRYIRQTTHKRENNLYDTITQEAIDRMFSHIKPPTK